MVRTTLLKDLTAEIKEEINIAPDFSVDDEVESLKRAKITLALEVTIKAKRGRKKEELAILQLKPVNSAVNAVMKSLSST